MLNNIERSFTHTNSILADRCHDSTRNNIFIHLVVKHNTYSIWPLCILNFHQFLSLFFVFHELTYQKFGLYFAMNFWNKVNFSFIITLLFVFKFSYHFLDGPNVFLNDSISIFIHFTTFYVWPVLRCHVSPFHTLPLDRLWMK